MNDWAQQLERWHDFCMLIGTAGATLMGLTFVAVSLAPDVIADRTTTAVRAFTTPIVAFFATNLIVCVVLLIPGISALAGALVFAATGLCGAAYILSTGVHQRWREYELGVDDWIWYLLLPLLAYCGFLACAIGVWKALPWATYVAATALLVLLVVGIRNAWDVVLAIAKQTRGAADAKEKTEPQTPVG